MSNSSRKSSSHSFGSGLGSSSILVIFVILCLVSFATLSIVSANADYKLSSKVLDRTDAYYAAANQAEASMAKLDQTLSLVYSQSENEDAYFEAVGHEKSFVIPFSDLQALEIHATIQYPKNDTDTFYVIDAWQVVITGDLEYEGTLNLIQ